VQKSLDSTIFVVCLCWLVVAPVYRVNVLSRFLIWPPLLFLGMISYSLYLWQQLFLAKPSLYLVDNALLWSPLMLAAATASHYFVERPFMRLGKRFIAR
jgi:peptidoglycan/LPS O-acetylase OafA/YrhL